MTQYLYRLRPARPEMLTAGPTPDESRILADHVAYLAHAGERGDALLFGRTQTADEHTFGVVILAMPDEAAARAFMENDPAVKHGVMTAQLFPFKIAGGSWARA